MATMIFAALSSITGMGGAAGTTAAAATTAASTAATTATVASTISNVLSAGSALAAIGQGMAGASAAKAQASLLDAQAAQERAEGAQQARDLAREYRELVGEQKVAMLANGLDIGTGSGANVIQATQAVAERNISVTRENARNRSAMTRLRSRGLLSEARASLMQGIGSAGQIGLDAYRMTG